MYDKLSDREILLLTAQNVDGLNSRLDKLNGTVGKTADRVGALEQWRSGVDGMMSTGKLVLGSGGILAVVAWALGWIKG